MSKPVYRFTNAPECYDWGWTTTLNPTFAHWSTGRDAQRQRIRLIRIDDEWHAETQIARYGSGPFICWTEEQMLEEAVYGYLTFTPVVGAQSE